MMNTTCYRLVVCEKPSVARSIAAVLGAGKRGDGFLSGGGYLVSWCFGHLAELSDADAYDEKFANGEGRTCSSCRIAGSTPYQGTSRSK